jgi:hypothetical protein
MRRSLRRISSLPRDPLNLNHFKWPACSSNQPEAGVTDHVWGIEEIVALLN